MSDNNPEIITNMQEHSDQTVKPYIAAMNGDIDYYKKLLDSLGLELEEYKKYVAGMKTELEELIVKTKQEAVQEAVQEAIAGSTAFEGRGNLTTNTLEHYMAHKYAHGEKGYTYEAGTNLQVHAGTIYAPGESGIWLMHLQCRISTGPYVETWNTSIRQRQYHTPTTSLNQVLLATSGTPFYSTSINSTSRTESGLGGEGTHTETYYYINGSGIIRDTLNINCYKLKL